MGAHSITLHLPDALYDHFKSQAKRARRSLEAELLRAVATAVPTALGSRELSLDEAAALLNLSRPLVAKLLDAGELPHRGAEDDRRVELGDLIEYKQRDLARRRRILAELTAEAQDMGLDY